MTNISASPGSGISKEELALAIPDMLRSKRIHLYWVEKAPREDGSFTFTTKMDINGSTVLLRTRTSDCNLIRDWGCCDPKYHTNARLVALERILTDPVNEDTLISL